MVIGAGNSVQRVSSRAKPLLEAQDHVREDELVRGLLGGGRGHHLLPSLARGAEGVPDHDGGEEEGGGDADGEEEGFRRHDRPALEKCRNYEGLLPLDRFCVKFATLPVSLFYYNTCVRKTMVPIKQTCSLHFV